MSFLEWQTKRILFLFFQFWLTVGELVLPSLGRKSVLKMSQSDVLKAKANSLPTRSSFSTLEIFDLEPFSLFSSWPLSDPAIEELQLIELAFMLTLAKSCYSWGINEGYLLLQMNKIKRQCCREVFFLPFARSTQWNTWARERATLWCRRRYLRRPSVFFSPLMRRGRWRSSRSVEKPNGGKIPIIKWLKKMIGSVRLLRCAVKNDPVSLHGLKKQTCYCKVREASPLLSLQQFISSLHVLKCHRMSV